MQPALTVTPPITPTITRLMPWSSLLPTWYPHPSPNARVSHSDPTGEQAIGRDSNR